ncbi:PREDICTED: LOW QUALITY PROTEIN: THO complex subunit 4B-like [Tarenaya hassleriana]|uniref:LOW QUALITY PROTEIN: THO complex subunit 4B-like n=1 Tax=Tarenaya hassleriana TaxID=28532 RepID=UPI00053C90CF|nr:PREDICTED: LOW QUALITY PROTEIN: THO complex subunit 4B-like [Tarenaya hassleriana]
MSSALDMSLDDIIKTNRKSTGSRGGRGGGGRGSGGPDLSGRFSNRIGNRAAPYSRPVQSPDLAWQHDMFAADTAGVAAGFGGHPAGGASSIETGTKLYISNLEYGVSNEDIKELFSEVGDLKRYGIHYDRSGRSKGTAEVVFSRRADAMAAVKRYNNVQLDGKPMNIEIVGTNLSAPAPPPLPANVMFGNLNGAPRRGRGRGGFMGRPRGGGGGIGGGRGGRGRGRGRNEKISAEDLDAELDNYHKEAMETEGGI